MNTSKRLSVPLSSLCVLLGFAAASPLHAVRQDAPLSVVVLVDLSASLGGARQLRPLEYHAYGRMSTLPGEATQGGFALKGMAPGDRVLSGAIGRTVRLASTFTSNRDQIDRDWNAVFSLPMSERFGPSPIWDAAAAGVRAVRDETGRRAVILVTDGEASGDHLGRAEVAALAVGSNVSVSVVGEEPALGPTLPYKSLKAMGIDPMVNLQALTVATGGIFRFDAIGPKNPDYGRDPEGGVHAVLERLHASGSPVR